MTSHPPPTPSVARLQRQRRWAVGVCLAAVLLLAVASALPPFALFGQGHGHMLSTHLLLELFSVIVSLLVVSIAWYTRDEAYAHLSKALIFGFTVVAGADVMHALSYAGMPALFSESSTPKAIFFWLMGRSFEVLTVWWLATRVHIGGSKGLWLLLGLITVVALTWMGSFHLDTFPETFVPGQGLTPFKVRYEYVLCAANLAAAGWLFHQSRREPRGHALWLGTACFVMGVGELAFTGYNAPSDFLNMFGHLYKVASFGIIYHVTFQVAVREPYARLAKTERQVRQQERQLDTVLNNIPVGVSQIDANLHYRYVNAVHANNLGRPVADIIGARMADVLPEALMSQARPHIESALGGHEVAFDIAFVNFRGRQVHVQARMVPQRTDNGDIVGAVAIVKDVTEQEKTQKQLLESMREITELKAALDAHAIVAVTDARGVITRVNDKFCSISKYPRSELIGRTHQLINSGHHSKAFFGDLWHTISSGEVWSGEICNRAKDGSLYWVHTTIVPFVGADGIPEQYIAIRADITERKRAEDEAQRMAFFDALTGLPNRRLMSERLHLALMNASRSGDFGALVLLDLDHFKEVNDTLGHFQGDELLRQVAMRLQRCVRQTDTVARLGGDEFVLVLGGLGADATMATARAGDLGEKVRETLAERYHFNGLQVDAAASIGVVMFHRAEEHTDELLKQADMALYRAKAAGRNRLAFFDPALQDEVNARAAMLRDLRQAMETLRFQVFYQPIVNTHSRVMGVEALVRWPHPERGMVSPAVFIPLAEQSGLIQPLGQWVLTTACRQLAAWHTDPERSLWTMAVNVSARQFRDADFVQKVMFAIQSTGANPHLLRLELTESMLHSDIEETIEKMSTLRLIGVRFSLDDFGTGYSSLSYLKRLPLDQLKIDQSFVRDVLTEPNDAAIACTILSLAKSLGLGVVAEGVETLAQRDFLLEQGCTAFQGYLFSRPVPATQLTDTIAPPVAA
ncbi:EAL domain-containing protein [Hydrogenophaga defluvii]|uniref:EAL domain-containing protein n=1 Tax=Hydrogenophaga defluvii TaxID=249410 RepID=A0ABW2SH87_9BURK